MKITQLYYLCIICAFDGSGCLVSAEGHAALHVTKKSICLNPPRTARRVETFIKECQEEVKIKLINEALQILKDEVAKEQPPHVTHDHDGVDFIELTESPPQQQQQQQHYDSYLPQYSQHNKPQDSTTSEELPYGYVDEYAATGAADAASSTTERMSRLMRRIRRVGRVGDLSAGIYHPTLVPFEDKRIAGCLLHCVYAKNHAIDKLGWPTLDGLVDFYSEGVNEHGFFMATLRSVNLCLRAVTSKYHVDRRLQPERGESCDLAFDVFDCISDQITGYCLDHYQQYEEQ